MQRFLYALFIFAGVAVCLAEHDPGHEEGAEWSGKPWLGKWVSVPEKDENVLNFITEIGVAASHPDLPAVVTVLVNHYKKGEEYHQRLRVMEVADLDDHDIVYKLGEETKNVFNGTTFSVKYDEKDGALVGHVMLPSNNATYKNEFKVEGDFLVKVVYNYKLGERSVGSYGGSAYSVHYEKKDGALVGIAHYKGTKEQKLNITMHNVYRLEGARVVRTSTTDGVTEGDRAKFRQCRKILTFLPEADFGFGSKSSIA